jgi:hypothetical protein
MSGPPVNMPCFSMTVIRFRVHMDERNHEHPHRYPQKNRGTRPRGYLPGWLHDRFKLTQFSVTGN